MKRGFVNQKLGKRMSHLAGLRKAKLAASQVPRRGREVRPPASRER